MTKIDSHHYIKTLDGWRAIAVILVVLSHLKDAVLVKGDPLYQLFSWGLNGVDLFFAISGYLITHKLILEMRKNNNINFKKFYFKRFFRLMPVLWFYLAVIFILSQLTWISAHPSEFISSLTFWRNYLTLTDPHAHYTGQIWSLSLEEHFYFFLPLFLTFFKTPRKIILASAAIGLYVTLWRKAGTIPQVVTLFPWIQFDMWSTVGRFDALLYGVVLAYIQSYYPKTYQKLNFLHPALIIGLLFLIYYYPIPLKPTWEAIFYPLLIYSTIVFDKSMLAKVLEWKALKYIGQLSYSIYLWHMLFVYKAHTAPPFFQKISGEWISLIPTLAVAMISFHYIETPLRQWGYRLIKEKGY